MQAFTAFFKTLGATRIIAMGVVTIALIAFFAFLIARATAPQMAPLFTDLTVDGRFLADTEAAVKCFQLDLGLPIDGVVTTSTWTELLPDDPVPTG